MLRFEKWQGLGNDFVIVEEAVDPERAQRLCDRRFGVGGDGVLALTGSDRELRMVVINADGSRPEMCGNGLRCVVGHIARRRGLDEGEIVVTTDAGNKRCAFRRTGEGYEVRVAMGVAELGEVFTFEHGGKTWRFTPVDMGNPHAVTFDEHTDVELDAVGPALQKHRPGGVNVELCRLVEGRLVEGRLVEGGIDVIVHERGVGRTLACGTGACAVAAAACHLGHVRHDAAVPVRLPGGRLEITVASGSREITMVGPATRVFGGETAL